MKLGRTVNAPPFPARNWTHGDSTVAGLSLYPDTSIGWPAYLPHAKRPTNLAVPSKQIPDVERFLFAQYLGNTDTSWGPGEWVSCPRPDRIIIMAGTNDAANVGSTTTQTTRRFRMATLIRALLDHGIAPYGTGATGQPDFLFMTPLPYQFGSSNYTSFHNALANSTADYLAFFGEIANPNNVTGTDGDTSTVSPFTLGGSPPVSIPSGLRCFINTLPAVVDPAHSDGLNPLYSYDGTHLNQAGERAVAAFMAPYFLS